MMTLSRAEKLEMVEEALELLSRVGVIVAELDDAWLNAYLCNEWEPSSEQGSHFGGAADKLAYYAANLPDDEEDGDAADY
ncbi:MAG: hypothetical protein M3Q29_01105 [Chloroflexota bacterium]|nr:hypothetical protein [Chloroflexota bacterium]